MMFHNQTEAWRSHNCGLYYTTYANYQQEHVYLPQVELQAHSTILSTTSRTTLTQTFVNPSTTKGIKEVKYTFPLYDGVSVVGFTCQVGGRTIVGEVKEKEKAKAVFKEAISRGETAALFAQLPDAADVFTTSVGNIPPGARVIVRITYLGELRHDMEVDGIRYTIPNIICPRYGRYPRELQGNEPHVTGSGISITVDAEMADGSFIQKMQSPTHPISISMGTTSLAPNSEPTMTRASATLSLDTALLTTDFVLQIVAKTSGVPKAILEEHPTIPNQRALMATLVPKFALPSEKPEVVFVCDRSGSMGGSNIALVKKALKVFLKSLPVGVKFNICSFGSHHSFLWPRSVTYSQQSLDEAVQHAETFDANYGGTEMLQPLKATIKQRYNDMALEVILLTDGEIWNQQELFSYLNSEIAEKKEPIRVFTLGIGNGVSHALIEGIARAGNGFTQTVGEGEKMDAKVVRMLKGSLSPHVSDYKLEVKYSDSAPSSGEDDFEIIEKVADSLTVKLDLNKDEKEQEPKKSISLFDESVNVDQEEPRVHDDTGESRYAHLPTVPAPKFIQAPQNIPPLFAFNRTTVYLLLGPDAPQKTPKSVLLRGTSAHGPLELDIPIQILETPGETIHQLAAKKATAELEQGRGWLPEARDESGQLIKSKFQGRFDDMVEREAVRLGVQFQVGGKWCSFVAVEKKNVVVEAANGDYEWLDDNAPGEVDSGSKLHRPKMKLYGDRNVKGEPTKRARNSSWQIGTNMSSFGTSQPHFQAGVTMQQQQQQQQMMMQPQMMQQQIQTQMQHSMQPAPYASSYRPTAVSSVLGQQGASLMSALPHTPGQKSAQPTPTHTLQDHQMQLMLLEQQNKKRLLMARQEQDQDASSGTTHPPAPAFSPSPPQYATSYAAPCPPRSSMSYSSANIDYHPSDSVAFGASPSFSASFGSFGSNGGDVLQNFDFDSFLHGQDSGSYSFGGFGDAAGIDVDASPQKRARVGGSESISLPKTDDELLDFLVALQLFEGYWSWDKTIFTALKVPESKIEQAADGVDKAVFITAFVVKVFETRLQNFQGSWELVVNKAKEWLVGTLGEAKAEEVLNKAAAIAA